MGPSVMKIPWDQPARARRYRSGLEPNGIFTGKLSDVVAVVWNQTVTGDGWMIWLDDKSQKWEGSQIVELYSQLPDGI